MDARTAAALGVTTAFAVPDPNHPYLAAVGAIASAGCSSGRPQSWSPNLLQIDWLRAPTNLFRLSTIKNYANHKEQYVTAVTLACSQERQQFECSRRE